MGFLGDVIGSFTGSTGAKAAKGAAGAQIAQTDIAIEDLQEARTRATGGLEPFAQAGEEGVEGLSALITDPEVQKAFIEQNPFFKSLAQDAQDRLLANQAARGKIGSGGTAAELQNRLLQLGTNLVGQNITQRQNLAQLGLSAAGTQAQAELGFGVPLSGLQTGRGATEAGGILGAQAARAAGVDQTFDLAGKIFGIGL